MSVRAVNKPLSRRALLWVALAACWVCALPMSASSAEPSVSRDGEALVYRGVLAPETIEHARQLLEEGGVRRLRITSGGGEIGLGMDLGELVQRHALDVEIVGICASSCANYVFPAGARKLLAADAVLVWHGSAIQDGVGDAAMIDFDAVARLRGRALDAAEKADMIERFAAYGREMRERQSRYYAALGVDPRVTVFGQEVDCACDWTIPVEDMARFGITGVESAPGYGAGLASLQKPVAMLRLEDHPHYAAAIDAARIPNE